MIHNEVRLGKNRTGLESSPIDKRRIVEAAERTVPSTEGDGSALDGVRAEYLVEDISLGSLPPPLSLKAAAEAIASAVTGEHMPVFLDKLGERLAFERTGVRLYGALIDKLDASDPLPGGPSREELEAIQADELAHFELLREAMLALGADPTAITPSADVAAVASSGILQVVADPRVNLKQSIEAMLIAELVDSDGWSLLAELARSVGQKEWAEPFDIALSTEEDHLAQLRQWVVKSTLVAGAGKAVDAE